MSGFKNLHPICSFSYFAAVIILVLVCQNPIAMLEALTGAVFFLHCAEKGKVWKRLRYLLPMLLLIAFANPLLNHRGVTRLVKVMNQWVTLEALCYGITAGLSLAALILWFGCYQEVITSDKFLYLFGKAAPGTALLISMALNLVPKLEQELQQIREGQEMLYPEKPGRMEKIRKAIRHVSTLLGWSLENTVEQVDSMKARGYGLRRRTTFHLFRFESGDYKFMLLLLLLGGSCITGRCLGYGTMEFYPRMDSLVNGAGDILFYLVFLVLMWLPGLLEWREELLWRSYDLNL